MTETCPGMKVIKEYLSPSDLSEHYAHPHAYGPVEIFYLIRKNAGFRSCVENLLTGKSECVLEVIAFGCDQVIIYSYSYVVIK